MLLQVEDIWFSYSLAGQSVPVLKGISLSVARGDFVAIQGRSGSGKSTLFHLIGCLLKPDKGRVLFAGHDLTQLSADELAVIRNKQIGFVFQQFHLLPRATVLENILLPSLYPVEAPSEKSSARAKATRLAELVGLGDKLGKLPNQLSGGEQQRVVVARALMADADLILADEPTGNLDTQNAAIVMQLLKDLNEQGKTIILITHDMDIAKLCKKSYRIEDGVFIDHLEAKGTAPRSEPKDPSLFQSLKGLKGYLRLAGGVAPLALENLRRNKIRAFLTMLGVTVGIASVFSMLTFGNFASEKIVKGYEELGVNTVMIRGYPNWRQRAIDSSKCIICR